MIKNNETILLGGIIQKVASESTSGVPFLKDIPDITFQSSENITDFELLPLTELFSRIDKTLNHDPKQPHRISFFALLIVTEGLGSHQVDLKKYPLQKGSVLKIAKGQVHAFQDDIDYNGYLVVFTENFVLKYFSKSSIEFISHLYNYHISEPLVENSSFNETFLNQITQELESENTYAQKNIVAKMLELYLLKLERQNHTISSTKLNKEHYPIFFQFKDLVEKSYRNTRNAKDYAENMTISTKHLNKIVKSFTLNTAKHFIDQYVILEIKRAILSTDKSLKEIAYDQGFNEVTNFTKFFKKHTDCTPKEYRTTL